MATLPNIDHRSVFCGFVARDICRSVAAAPISKLTKTMDRAMFRFLREAKCRMQIRPLIEQAKYLLAHHAIQASPGDWDDPYLLGYYNGATLGLLQAGSEGLVDAKSIGVVQAWGWEELTTLPRDRFLVLTASLFRTHPDEWNAGFQAGILWSTLSTEGIDQSAPKVREALEASRTLAILSRAGGDELRNAAAFVFQRDWFGYIANKVGESALSVDLFKGERSHAPIPLPRPAARA